MSTKSTAESFESFLQSILPVLVAVFLATLLYRRFGVRVPGWEPAQTIEEKLDETMGALNARERQEGRAPFVLTRIVPSQLSPEAERGQRDAQTGALTSV